MTPLDDASTDAAQQDHRGLGLVTAFLPAPQHTAAVAAFADLIGPTEAARRLDLPITTVRSARRTAARTPAGTPHPASPGTATVAGD